MVVARTRSGLVCAMAASLAACASVPKGYYGVDRMDFVGTEQVSDAAIRRCLLTVERDRFGIPLGLTQTECEAPPFDSSAPRLELWAWPWSDWAGLNTAVVEVDHARIERFYRARGFYDARVVEVRYDPPEAEGLRQTQDSRGCDPRAEECAVRITIVVEEGAPLRVGRVEVHGVNELPPEARELIAEAELPQPGERFDEADHDRAKAQLVEHLAEASYAGATVKGEVRLDHGRKLAHVDYFVKPGPAYRFGDVVVEGNEGLPADPIVAAAGIERGRAYRQSALSEVQDEVYAMGAFSAVEVERELDAERGEARLRVHVTPLPDDALRFGIGVTSGAMQRTQSGAVESVPQWDVHLLARYERRHLLGTLGKLRIEDRPRLIFQEPFPSAADPRFGNLVRLRLNEPGLIEARTELIFEGLWDWGPDAFVGFQRSDIALRLGGRRGFLRRILFATLAIQHDRFLVAANATTTDGSEPPDSYVFSFVEQELQLDLRDAEIQPRQGGWLSVLSSQSLQSAVSDWTSVRLVPDLRGYVPLPLHMVLAARFALGALFVLGAREDLDAASRELGPFSYRLRGGGAQSNRGFVAGELGAGREGGLRRWEGSLELRVRLGTAFGVVGFFDVGDVNRGRRFRFEETNPSAGFGLRYLTLVGAIRLDVGFRLGTAPEEAGTVWLLGSPGALHLTIGEAF